MTIRSLICANISDVQLGHQVDESSVSVLISRVIPKAQANMDRDRLRY